MFEPAWVEPGGGDGEPIPFPRKKQQPAAGRLRLAASAEVWEKIKLLEAGVPTTFLE